MNKFGICWNKFAQRNLEQCTSRFPAIEEGFAPDAPAQAKEGFATMLLLHRYGAPEEVSQLMLFLASDDSSYCTGGVYMVDGGMSA